MAEALDLAYVWIGNGRWDVMTFSKRSLIPICLFLNRKVTWFEQNRVLVDLKVLYILGLGTFCLQSKARQNCRSEGHSLGNL